MYFLFNFKVIFKWRKRRKCFRQVIQISLTFWFHDERDENDKIGTGEARGGANTSQMHMRW